MARNVTPKQRENLKPGNTGGGRPPSVVVAECREGFFAALPRMKRIATGEIEAPISESIRATELLGKYGRLATVIIEGEETQEQRFDRTLADIASRAASRSLPTQEDPEDGE